MQAHALSGIRITTNGNQSSPTTPRPPTDGGLLPDYPSTEMARPTVSFAEGKLNVFGAPKLAVETRANIPPGRRHRVLGLREAHGQLHLGQGVVYGPSSTTTRPASSRRWCRGVARALTKHALNVHCGHDDITRARHRLDHADGKDAQQASTSAHHPPRRELR